MTIKWLLSRRVRAVGVEIGSTAVRADAWHHLSDAVMSAAAFVCTWNVCERCGERRGRP